MKTYRENFLRYYPVLQISLAITFGLVLIYYLLQSTGFPVSYVSLTTYHIIIVPTIELFVASFIYRFYLGGKHGRSEKQLAVLAFLVFTAAFYQPFYQFYLGGEREEYAVIQQLKPLLQALNIGLMTSIPVLLFGGVWRQKSLEFLEMISETILMSKVKYQRGEEARSNEFNDRFRRIAETPLVGFAIKAIYREGAVTILLLLALIVVGFGLRAWNLTALNPYSDEYSSLLAAKSLYESQSTIGDIFFIRSFFIVTLPVYISYEIFGVSIWSARFAGVVINMLAIIPLYLIGKRINKPIAILAVALYCTNPWMIATARNVREYAYHPVYFYLVVLLMLGLFENLPDIPVIKKDLRKILSVGNILRMFTLVAFLIFALGEPSTLKIIGVLYLAFGLVFLLSSKFNVRSKSSIFFLILVVVAFSIIVQKTRRYIIRFFRPPETLNDFYLGLLFGNPEQQWYFDRLPYIGMILVIVTLLTAAAINKRSYAIQLILLIYIGNIAFFSFFLERIPNPRYATYINYWHILVIGIGLFVVFSLIQRLMKHKYTVIAGAVLGLLFFNWNQVLLPALYDEGGVHPITRELHDEMRPAVSYLSDRIDDEDVLVATMFRLYVIITEDLNFSEVIQYRYNDPMSGQVLNDTISAYDGGWIVLEARGFAKYQPLPLGAFEFEGTSVEYHGQFAKQLIYSWGD